MPDLETWTEGCKDSNCKLFITLFGKEPPLEDLKDNYYEFRNKVADCLQLASEDLDDTEAFEEHYDEVMDMEKKQFYNALLTDIQIYEEEQDKQIIKSIGFKFPVFYDGEFTKRIIRDKGKTVETVVGLHRKDM